MPAISFDRLLSGSGLASSASTPTIARADELRADRSIRLTRPDAERLEGRFKGGSPKAGAGAVKASNLSQGLKRRAAMLRHVRDRPPSTDAMPFDKRQRVIVKVHYFNHAGGGGAALKAHVRYVARDAAGRDDLDEAGLVPDGRSDRDHDIERGRAHADYLARRERNASPFYDAANEGVDGAARAADWAARDKRHFRLIISPERGELINDLPAYTREVMAYAERHLRTRLDWVAVDHHDTDNPHTHLILRGRRQNGQDLILPRDFVRHGLRGIARDVATEWLGPRSPTDERLAYQAEIIRHAPTRLDRMIAQQLPENGRVQVSKLHAPNGDPVLTQGLKARAKELTRLGLATETRSPGFGGPGRGAKVLTFQPDWQDRLKALELHINIGKQRMAERTAQRHAELKRAMKRMTRGLDR